MQQAFFQAETLIMHFPSKLKRKMTYLPSHIANCHEKSALLFDLQLVTCANFEVFKAVERPSPHNSLLFHLLNVPKVLKILALICTKKPLRFHHDQQSSLSITLAPLYPLQAMNCWRKPILRTARITKCRSYCCLGLMDVESQKTGFPRSTQGMQESNSREVLNMSLTPPRLVKLGRSRHFWTGRPLLRALAASVSVS